LICQGVTLPSKRRYSGICRAFVLSCSLRLLLVFLTPLCRSSFTSRSRGTFDVLFLQAIQSGQLASQLFSYSVMYTGTCTLTLTPASLESLLEAKIQYTLSSCNNKLTLQAVRQGCSRVGSGISFRGGVDVQKTYSWDLESDFDA
jgi:hypothetical protein